MRGAPDPGWQGALWGTSLLAGVALQLNQAALWPGSWAAALAAVGALGAVLGWYGRRRWAGTLLLACALGALVFAGTSQRAGWRLQQALPSALEGQDLLVTGVIAQMPRSSLSGTRFVLAVESASLAADAGHAPLRLPPLLSLGWFRGVDDDALVQGPGLELRAGQRWQLSLRLRQPHGVMNPHGFDLELWLFEQGIGANGSVRAVPGAINHKLADDVGYPFERLRQRLRDGIDRQVPERSAAGVLAALAIGDQGAIGRTDWDLFRITGVAHLMSISGLHVTMFAWAAGAVVGWLWRCSPRLLLAVPAPLAARWGGLVLAAGYALLAGWGVPAQRTVWMIAVVVLLRTLGWRWPQPLVLLAAAVVVALADPWALLQPGFWLSFVAVFLLIGSEPVQAANVPAENIGWRQHVAAAVRGGLRTQWIATLGLAPLSMLFFQQISIVGFVANLVAIPLVTLFITPLALAGTLLPVGWSVAAALTQALLWFLQGLASWPWAVWEAAAAPPWAAACGLLAAALALLPLPWRLRALSLPLVLPLLWPIVPRPGPGQFELVAADIGQGTAVLVRTQHHLLVYDTGPAYSPEADAGGRVLLPLLRARGERAVDLLMLSHRDSDHVGGAASLLAGTSVRAISSSLRDDHVLLATAGGLPRPHSRCDAGQSWLWDGVRFDVLHPRPQDHASAVKANPLSCVLRVQGEHFSALLTGDIEAAQEAALVQRAGSALKSDVLIVPHHGSRTSSTPAFIDAVAPRVALAQAAYRSRFGHPVPAIVARYVHRGVIFKRSDACGAWTVFADGSSVCERDVGRRYWHHPAALPTP